MREDQLSEIRMLNDEIANYSSIHFSKSKKRLDYNKYAHVLDIFIF